MALRRRRPTTDPRTSRVPADREAPLAAAVAADRPPGHGSTPLRRETAVAEVDLSSLHRSQRSGYKRALVEIAGLDYTDLDDAALFAHIGELATWMRADPTRPLEARGETFALVAEAAARILGQRPYLVQHLGALVVTDGQIAEMATGEGKTLSSALAVAWAALAGFQVHVMTANDYLAGRDASWMGTLYAALGLSVGVTLDTTPAADRHAAYRCDVVYGTATQFGFDYLNDHLVVSHEAQAQRDHQWAVVDEADALLIDDARTPLIISGAGLAEQVDRVQWASWAAGLREHDYEFDLADHQVWLTEAGMRSAERCARVPSLFHRPQLVSAVQAALHARVLTKNGRDYLVVGQEGAQFVGIVDEGTGRVLDGRRWRDGIHEAIEAKEGLPVRAEMHTLASITIPSYLARYDHVGGMSGTAKSAEDELAHLYDLPVLQIPTHRPRIRLDLHDVLYSTLDEKMDALVADITRRHQLGQPVLVGAPTVEDAHMVSERLSAAGLVHHVLSARHPEVEAAVIAQAGRVGAITVATNMAGRGVDILLGGDPEKLARAASVDGTVDPGTLATARAQCAIERDEVLAAGGLAVLATARHSSKRIDEQLRGRGGRQGEPGTSQCYLSCEDELVAPLITGRISLVLDRIATLRGEAIQHRIVDSMVDDAQARIEGNHIAARGKQAGFDKVYAAQMAEVYRFRDAVLTRHWKENLAAWWELANEQGVLGDIEWPFAHDHEDVDVQGTDGYSVLGAAADVAERARHDVVMADDWDTWDTENADDTWSTWTTSAQDDAVGAQREDEDAEAGAVTLDAGEVARLVAADSADLVARCNGTGDPIMDIGMAYVLATTIDASWQNMLSNLDALRAGIDLRSRAGSVESQFGREAHRHFLTMTTRMAAIGVRDLRRVAFAGDAEAATDPATSDQPGAADPSLAPGITGSSTD